MTSISPNLSNLKSTFSASPVFTMSKKLFMFLNQMILDLSTREFLLLFSIWKNESAFPMAHAPANSTKSLLDNHNKGRERS